MRRNCFITATFTIGAFLRITFANEGLELAGSPQSQNASFTDNHHHPHHHGVQVASFKLNYVKAELILALFILVIGLFKLRKFSCI